ncbi:hepatic lectin-like protein, partial [Leptotrombidium deliense]
MNVKATHLTSIIIIFSDCPTTRGWKKTQYKCIYIHNEDGSYADSQAVCNKLGHSLVMPKTESELVDLHNHVKMMKIPYDPTMAMGFWVGMKRDKKGNLKYTDGTNVNIPHRYWEGGFPSAGYRKDFHCVAYFGERNQLILDTCDDITFPICDRALSPMPEIDELTTPKPVITTPKPTEVPKVPEIVPKPHAASTDALNKLNENENSLKQANDKITNAEKDNKQNIENAKTEINSKLKDEEAKTKE